MTIDSALRRIREADDTRTDRDVRDQQYEMYEKTLKALEEIDEDDENEGVAVVTAWIIEQIETAGDRPSSRSVRRRARQFCRNNGYDLPDDSWLVA